MNAHAHPRPPPPPPPPPSTQTRSRLLAGSKKIRNKETLTNNLVRLQSFTDCKYKILAYERLEKQHVNTRLLSCSPSFDFTCIADSLPPTPCVCVCVCVCASRKIYVEENKRTSNTTDSTLKEKIRRGNFVVVF